MIASRGMGNINPKKKPRNTAVSQAPDPGNAKGFSKGGNWIKGAIKKPGALRSALGAKKGEPIPAKKLAAAAKKPGKLGQRARFAEVLKGFKKK